LEPEVDAGVDKVARFALIVALANRDVDGAKFFRGFLA
jgi:hypothetical protein